MSRDIVDTALAAGQFTTLAKALQAANLAGTLKGAGPFTVFAPTDAAFAKLPPATLDAFLKDPAELAKILTYHVVAGKVDAASVVKLTQAQADLAGALEVTQSLISNWEAGRTEPPLSLFLLLCDELNLSAVQVVTQVVTQIVTQIVTRTAR